MPKKKRTKKKSEDDTLWNLILFIIEAHKVQEVLLNRLKELYQLKYQQSRKETKFVCHTCESRYPEKNMDSRLRGNDRNK